MLLNERIRKRKVDARTRACVCVRACGKYLSIFFLFFNSKSSSISRSSDENVDKGNAWKKKNFYHVTNGRFFGLETKLKKFEKNIRIWKFMNGRTCYFWKDIIERWLTRKNDFFFSLLFFLIEPIFRLNIGEKGMKDVFLRKSKKYFP